MDVIFISILSVILLSAVLSLISKKNSNEVNNNLWQKYTRGKTKGQFYNRFIAILSIFASLNGGFMVMGLVQVGYEGGISGYILGLSYVIGSITLIYFLKKTNNANLQSGLFGLDSILLNKYGPNTLKAFYFVTFVVFAGVLGGQLVSISQFYNAYGTDNSAIFIVIGIFSTVVYTFLNGFKGVLKNDILQSTFELSVGIILPLSLFIFLQSNNGTVSLALSEKTLGGDYGSLYPIFGALFLMLAFTSRADLWQRVSMVKPKHRNSTILFSGILLCIYYFAMTTCGIWIHENKLLFGVTNETNLSGLTISVTNSVVELLIFKIICLCGILIAILSSIDSYLNLTSISLTKFSLWNSIPKINNEDLTVEEQKTLIINAKVLTFVVAILACIFAYFIPDIVDLVSSSFSLIGILFPIVIIGVLGKFKINDRTGALALWSSLIALIISLPFLREIAFLVAFFAGLIVFFGFLFRDFRAVHK